jgi:hypothetical protein
MRNDSRSGPLASEHHIACHVPGLPGTTSTIQPHHRCIRNAIVFGASWHGSSGESTKIGPAIACRRPLKAIASTLHQERPNASGPPRQAVPALLDQYPEHQTMQASSQRRLRRYSLFIRHCLQPGVCACSQKRATAVGHKKQAPPLFPNKRTKGSDC